MITFQGHGITGNGHAAKFRLASICDQSCCQPKFHEMKILTSMLVCCVCMFVC